MCWELEGKRKMGFRWWCGVRLYQRTASHVETRLEKGSRLAGSWELITGSKQHNRDTPECERSCTWQPELRLERNRYKEGTPGWCPQHCVGQFRIVTSCLGNHKPRKSTHLNHELALRLWSRLIFQLSLTPSLAWVHVYISISRSFTSLSRCLFILEPMPFKM